MKIDQKLDALINLPTVRGIHVSPDGKWVVWTWFGLDDDIYIAKTDGTGEPKRVSFTDQRPWVSSWLWDSSGFIYFYDTDGDEESTYFRLDLDSLEKPVKILDKPKGFFIRNVTIDPTAKYIAFSANYDYEESKIIESIWIHRKDLKSGAVTTIAKPKKPIYTVPRMNSLGTHIIYNRSDIDPSGEQLWLASTDGSDDKEILNLGDKVKVSGTWHPDGKRVVISADTGSYRRVGIWDIHTEKTQWLIDDPSRDISRAFSPPRTSKIVVEDTVDTRVKTTLLDPDTAKEEQLHIKLEGFEVYAPSEVEGSWIVETYNSKQPRDIVLVKERDASKPVSISKVWNYTKLTQKDLVKAEEVSWTSSDGLLVKGWLYRALSSESKGTIVQVHGGPTGHSADEIDSEIQYYTSCGFNVFDPNYRGSTGYGLEFQESIKEDGWGAKEQDDILSGIKMLIDQNIASKGKVGITGTSYGGYSAWHAITHAPTSLVAAAAPVCGMTDLVVDYETTRPDLRGYSEEMLGGSPEQVPDIYHNASPINFIKNIKGKLLIVQGKRDPNVTIENVKAVEGELDKHNVEYEQLLFDDEGHGIRKTVNKKIAYSKIAQFFENAFQESP